MGWVLSAVPWWDVRVCVSAQCTEYARHGVGWVDTAEYARRGVGVWFTNRLNNIITPWRI